MAPGSFFLVSVDTGTPTVNVPGAGATVQIPKASLESYQMELVREPWDRVAILKIPCVPAVVTEAVREISNLYMVKAESAAPVKKKSLALLDVVREVELEPSERVALTPVKAFGDPR